MVVTPSVPSSTNVMLGEGKVYYNYTTTPVEIGATRGGSSLTIEREFKDIEFDGTYGSVKGMKRKIRVQPILKINALELSSTNLAYFYQGLTATPVSTYTQITENLEVSSTDYITDISFVGERLDGKQVAIIIKNALGDGNIELAMEAKEEVIPEVQFTGHYDSTTPTTPPYEIRLYNS